MEYDGRILNPTEEEFNRWLSTQTMRGTIGGGRLSDLAQEQPMQPMNTIRNNATGRVIDMNYATKPLRDLTEADQQAAIEATGGRRTNYDVHIDGPREVARRQLPDGRTEVIREYPALQPTVDGRLNQTSKLVREIETPDYLNPAASKQIDFKLKQAQLEKAQKEAEALSNPATAQMPKLKPGERWNPGKQAVEAVPGSEMYVKQSGLHGKDYAALQGVNQKMDFAIDRVNELLDPKNKAQIERNFGGYNAYITQFLPGAGIEGMNKIDALKSTLKNAGLEMMRTGGSIGQMTEREWPIVERMLANIDPRLNEADAMTELRKVSTFMSNLKENAMKAYETEWGNTQYYKPGAIQPPAPQQPNAAQAAQINVPDNAAAYLRKNPYLRKQFDLKYGEGASAQVLGQ